MTPVSQGAYEFKKESLIEIRKRIGIAQSKMADLLGIPPNTLSRWETGATVPDASALAAIYSLAKEYRIDVPLFFEGRTNILEIKISSNPQNQAFEPIALFQSFQQYLHTTIELIGTEVSPVIRVEVSNATPVTQSSPKIVFTGVGLCLAHIGGDNNTFIPSRIKTRIKHETKENQIDVGVAPWKHDAKMADLLKENFRRLDQKEFPEQTTDEGQHGEVLFPGQSVVYEFDVTSKLLPYLQFKVEGTVSRRHLFHYDEIFKMPEHITKPIIIDALRDFFAVDIYEPLESAIKLMPNFNNDTRLDEIQIFLKALSESMIRIKKNQEDLNKVFHQHQINWMRAHIRATYIFLDRVSAQFGRMKEAIGSNMPDKIAAEVSGILALMGEKAQLASETKDLIQANKVAEEELHG